VREAAGALGRQRDRLLGFVGELERQLQRAAEACHLLLYWLKRVYELEKQDEGTAAYWRQRAELAHQLGERMKWMAAERKGANDGMGLL